MANHFCILRLAFVFLFCVLISTTAFSKMQSDIEQKVSDLLNQDLYDSALVVINKHFQNLDNLSSKDQADAYFTRGLVYYNLDSFTESVKDFRLSIELYDNKYKSELYSARSRLSQAYQNLYEYDSMKVELDYLMENEQYSDSTSLLFSYYGMYIYYQRGPDKDIALDYIQKARGIAAGLGKHTRAATFDSYIGFLYYELENDSLAEIYQNRSLKYQLENENWDDASYVYLMRGTYYNGLEKWDLAEKDLLECLRLAEMTKNLSNIANCNQFLSSTYANTGRFEEAEKAIDHSMEICNEYDIDVCRVFAYMHYADLFLKSEDYEKAIKYGEMLVGFPTETYMNEVQQGYEILAEAYAADKQFQKAYSAKVLEKTFSDSLYNIENQEALSHVKEQYEREKNIVEINELKNKAKIEALKKKGLTWGLGLLALLSLIIINREVQRRKKAKQLHEAEIDLKELEEKRLKDELVYKNRELTTKALHIAKKNEVLQKLRSELEILAHEKGANECVREVVNTLKLEKSIDSNWDQFTKQFTDLNPTFYKELITRFPDLTKSELRLAALLRMNLSSKEIANMLNISDSGVKKARQRIRKKLELQSEDSLEGYILSV